MWNSPIFVDDFDTFRIFVKGYLTLTVLPEGQKKNVGPFLDLPKGQPMESKKTSRVFLKYLVFSGQYFYKNLPEVQEKKEPLVFLHHLVFSERYFYTLQYTADGTFYTFRGLN